MIIDNKNHYNEELFKLVFSNIVLFKLIYKHVKIFKKNEKIGINNREELRNYKERDYIQSLKYYGKEMLIIGDVPNTTIHTCSGSSIIENYTNSVLKEIEFVNSELSTIKGDVIPFGVEIIKFNPYFSVRTTLLSTLPSSVHTVKNVTIFSKQVKQVEHVNYTTNGNLILPPPSSIYKDDELDFDDKNYKLIPKNIKSISFKVCPSITQNATNEFITIPNTIKSLEFQTSWNNYNIELKQGDIPKGVTTLIMEGYTMKLNSSNILPSTLKELKMNFNNQKGAYEFIPLNLETLTICDCNYNIEPNLELNKFLSIKKLIINFLNGKFYIKPNSLPPNLKELCVFNIDYNICCNFFKNSIPSSVTSLIINSNIDQPDILPISLTSLEIVSHRNRDRQELIFPRMIPFFTHTSLILIKLPNSFKKYSVNIPKNIKILYNY